MDVFKSEYITAIQQSLLPPSPLVQKFDEPVDKHNFQVEEETQSGPHFPQVNNHNSIEESGESEAFHGKSIHFINALVQNKTSNQIKRRNLNNEEHTTEASKTKKKKKGRRPKGSTITGGHTWKEPGNQRTTCITTFNGQIFSVLKKLFLKKGIKLKKPNSGIFFGKNKKIQKQFFSIKLYQYLCTKYSNKKAISDMIAKNKDFRKMVNIRLGKLYEKYIKNKNSNSDLLKDNNCSSNIKDGDISLGYEGLCLEEGLKAKKENLRKEKKWNDVEIEERIESLKYYSTTLIEEVREEKNYKERKGEDSKFVYEVIQEFENSDYEI